MPQYKISDFESKAEPFKNKNAPAVWSKGSKKKIDFGQIEADQARPTLFSDPSGWWAGLSDDEKLQAIETFGELAGGTVGAVAGGGTPASIPGAGAGAVAGKGLARGVGRAMGLKPKPTTVGEELLDTAKTFGANAAGEGIGVAAGLAKPFVKRVAQKIIKPDLEVARLAEQAGVKLTPGMLSQRPLVQQGEAVLENTLGGMGTVRNKTQDALQASDANFRKIPAKFNPTPVDRPEAGTALQSQLSGNRAAAGAEFKPKYQEILRVAGDAPIDVSGFRDVARNFIDDLPANMEGYFPGDVLRKMKQAAGIMDGQATPAGLIGTGTPTFTFEEAQKLRTALLEAERAMSQGDAAIKRKAIPGLRDAIDRSIDDSLSGSPNPVHQQALQDWRKVNADYGATSRKLSNPGGKGNATAEVISGADNPDNLVNRIANSPTAIREAEVATTPMFGAPDENAIGKLRRSAIDSAMTDSSTRHRLAPNELLVNPNTFEKTLARNDGLQELTAPASLELEDAIKLGKAVGTPSQFANTSRTALFNQALGVGPMIGGAAYGAATSDGDLTDRSLGALYGAAGAAGVSFAAAKALNSDRFVNSLSKAPGVFQPARKMSPLIGAVGRATLMDPVPTPEAPASLEEEPKARTVRFKVSDFQ